MIKKLIFFYKNLVTYGGAEKLLVREINLLASTHNLSITLYCFAISEKIREKISNNVHIISEKNSYSQGNYVSQIKDIIKLYRYLSQNKFDLLVSASGVLESGLICNITKTKYSLQLHHPIVMLPMDSYRNAICLRRKITKNYPESWAFNQHSRRPVNQLRSTFEYLAHLYVFKKASRLYVLSDFARDEKKTLLNIDATVLHGGVDFKNDLCDEAQSFGGEQYRQEIFSFCTIGRIAPEKNIELMIESMAILVRKGLSIRLDLYGVGETHYINKLKRICSSMGIEENVLFKGYIPDDQIFAVLTRSDAFLYTQYADYSIAVFEALSAGCPPVIWENTWVPLNCLENKAVYFTKLNPKDYSAAMFETYLERPVAKKNLITNDFYINLCWEKRVNNFLSLESLL